MDSDVIKMRDLLAASVGKDGVAYANFQKRFLSLAKTEILEEYHALNLPPFVKLKSPEAMKDCFEYEAFLEYLEKLKDTMVALNDAVTRGKSIPASLPSTILKDGTIYLDSLENIAILNDIIRAARRTPSSSWVLSTVTNPFYAFINNSSNPWVKDELKKEADYVDIKAYKTAKNKDVFAKDYLAAHPFPNTYLNESDVETFLAFIELVKEKESLRGKRKEHFILYFKNSLLQTLICFAIAIGTIMVYYAIAQGARIQQYDYDFWPVTGFMFAGGLLGLILDVVGIFFLMILLARINAKLKITGDTKMGIPTPFIAGAILILLTMWLNGTWDKVYLWIIDLVALFAFSAPILFARDFEANTKLSRNQALPLILVMFGFFAGSHSLVDQDIVCHMIFLILNVITYTAASLVLATDLVH